MAKVFLAASSEAMTFVEAPVTGPPFAVSFWFRPTTVGVAQTMFWLGDPTSADEFWSVELDASDQLVIRGQDGASSEATATVATVTVDTWHHATAIFASNILRRISLDNQTEASGTDDLTPATPTTVVWGRRGDSSPTNYFDGYLLWGAIYSEIMASADKKPLADGASPLFFRREQLEAFYSFIEGEDRNLITGIIGDLVATPTNLAASPNNLASPNGVILPLKGYLEGDIVSKGITLSTA